MGLYTFFFEYDGGTYISQVSAEDAMGAARSWAEGFNLHLKDKYAGLFEKDIHDKLVRSVEEEMMVPIKGMVHTWCLSLLYLKRPNLVNFTSTL